MPRYWYERRFIGKEMTEEYADFCRKIVADKKPYFMRYVYPSLMRDYNTYIKTTNRNALREFGKTVDDLMSAESSELSAREAEFLQYYHSGMPVGMGDCTMNRICRRFEAEFDGYLSTAKEENEFDGSLLRSDAQYTRSQYNAIKGIVSDYNSQLRRYKQFAQYERVDEDEFLDVLSVMDEEFAASCAKVCTNEDVLCNIILDLCEANSIGKRFVWKISGSTIISNLLHRANGIIQYPSKDADGEIEYGGLRFTMRNVDLQEVQDDYSE